MNDWSTLEWLGAIAGIATVLGTIIAAYAFLRRNGSEPKGASASGDTARVAQVTNSPDTTIIADSPSAVVVRGDLHMAPGYAVDEHERIVNQRVAQARTDMERAHRAEVEALRAQIAALTEPEWDKDTIEAVQEAVATDAFDRAEALMATLQDTHLQATSIPAAEKQIRIRQMRSVIALVGGNAHKASEHVEAAAAILAAFDPIDAAEFRNSAAVHMQDYAQRTGGDGMLEAIRLYRINLPLLNPETHPEAWSETQHNLGNALLLLGVRSDNWLRLLAEAIDAFRAALRVCTRTESPSNWAQTQISLGSALVVLGRRSEGPEGTDYLAESVNILRTAEEVCTRASDPDSWAMIRDNLAIALANQGVRRGGEEGVRLLDEAIAVYRELLQVRTREQAPLSWAQIQTNLSFSLAQKSRLVSHDNVTEILSQADGAAHASLRVYTKERHPLDWAKTHANIGAILNEQSLYLERDADLQCLQASIAALLSALGVYKREDLPLQWAGVQQNLGVSHHRLALRQTGAERLDSIAKAIVAWRNALQVYTRAQHPLDWATAQLNLGTALMYRGEWTGGTQGLEFLHKAKTAIESTLQVYARDVHPPRWADAHRCLARVYESIGDLDAEHRLKHYERAYQEVDAALQVPPHDHNRECLEDARSTRERLHGNLAEFEGR